MAPAARIRQNHGQAPGPYARPPAQPRSRSSTPPLQNATHALDSERSPLPTDAHRLTRMVAMFWSSRSVLNADTELRRAIEDDREGPFRATASQEQKLNLQLRDELHELEPDLFEMLRTRDGFFVRHVRENLNEGQSGAKAEDNSKVKNAIVSWRAWSPPLTGAPKSSRGLSHLQCARLLAPLHVNFDDPEAQRQFIECSNPPMVAKNWPRLLYEGENGSISKPSEGLLQGELLIQTAKAILRTPSSVLPSNSARPNAPRRGRKGIASKYGLTKVTPAFIAYVAVMTRFAVSSEEDFDDAGGTFNYIAFYNQIREYLEAPRFRRRAEVLIGWWNRTLFPDSLDTGDDSDAGESHGGTLALLDAELEGDQDSPAEEQ